MKDGITRWKPNAAMMWLMGGLLLMGSVIAGCAVSGGIAVAPAPFRTAGGLQLLAPPDASLRSSLGLPPHDEELWVIEKPDVSRSPSPAAADAQAPGSGALEARLPEKPETLVPVPLRHTDVKASIAGYIATVDVTQQFQNPFNEKIEAVYVFPLPANAAVNEFIMTIGERKIRGIIREREQAEQIYREARHQGYVASLLTQERPNIFTQSVANIEPGKAIDVNIKYFHTLAYVDGSYEFVFPMVVGPRFNPPGFSDGVSAVPRGAPGNSGQKTEVQYLAPTERSGHDIALAVHLDAGVPIESIECKTHHVDVVRSEGNQADVSLAAGDTIPNRDFVLRYKVAGKTTQSAAIAQRTTQGDKPGGYFTLMLYPPENLANLPRQPLEMVFTLDVSGSQAGLPLEQSKRAIRYALHHMGHEDTFQLIRFGDTSKKFFPRPVPADAQNVTRAIAYMDPLDATEGTMLIDGLHASLLFPHDESRLRFVTFFTDGFIGNDAEAIGETHKCVGPSRIFSFGVGNSVNRYLLEGIAREGRGAVAYIGVNDRGDQAEEVMAQFFDRISHPALTDIRIDWGDMRASEVYPSRIPDLFVGRPVILTGRFDPGATGRKIIKVHGRAGGEDQEIDIPINLGANPSDASAAHAGIAAVWARAKIADLAEHATYEPNAELPRQVRQVALDYGLMSAFTAFVAVDTTAKTAGDHGSTVGVPVPVPDGVRYDTTVAPTKGSAE